MTRLRYEDIDDEGRTITLVHKAAKGRAPRFHILRYDAKLGNSDFIVHGHKPICAHCGSKKTVPCVEITEHDLFGKDHISTVRQCEKCGKNTVYKYILESRE